VQRIVSCLEVLDGFMKQSCPIVSSMVVADKHAGSGGPDSMMACVATILGMLEMLKSSVMCQYLLS
jgi:hypothetical protein